MKQKIAWVWPLGIALASLTACPEGDEGSPAAWWPQHDEPAQTARTDAPVAVGDACSDASGGAAAHTFLREILGDCRARVAPRSGGFIDPYRTAYVSLPEAAAGSGADVTVEQIFAGDELCRAEFSHLCEHERDNAAALWLFSLTEREGPLGHPRELTVSSPAPSGHYLVDGNNHKGIFFLSSPVWPTPVVVKFTRDSSEVEATARISLTPPIHAGARGFRKHPEAREAEINGPTFAVPLALGVFSTSSIPSQPPDGGILLMRRAGGAASQRCVSFDDETFLESLAGARLEGTALAHFQGYFLDAHSPHDLLAQPIWCHGDLHLGNVMVDHREGRVHYLDLESMHRCADGFDGELRQQVPLPKAVATEVDRMAEEVALTPGRCLEEAASWLATPTVRERLRRLDPAWLAARLRLIAFAEAYQSASPDFARGPLADAFDQLCREGMGRGRSQP